MSKVITFSRVFPAYHPRKGEPTFFLEKIWSSLNECYFDQIGDLDVSTEYFDPKHHTIRDNYRFKAGDYFSPRIWGTDINPKSGRSGPYQSKQIIIAPDIKIEKTWRFEIKNNSEIYIDGKFFYQNHISEWHENIELLAKNDGLTAGELFHWLKYPQPFDGQIICWEPNINY